MSVRSLSGSEHENDIDQIERLADAKGIELDEVEVIEDENDDGDRLVHFRCYETAVYDDDGEIDAEQSVAVQVTKMPEIQTTDDTFRRDVQNKLSALKKYLSGESPEEQAEELDAETTDDTDEDTGSQRQTADVDRSIDVDEDAPGATIDAQLASTQQRLDELEQRVDELEQYVDALEGLQQLLGDE